MKLRYTTFTLKGQSRSVKHKLTPTHQNHVITLEITSGQVYRGKLLEGPFSPVAGCSAPKAAEEDMLMNWIYSGR